MWNPCSPWVKIISFQEAHHLAPRYDNDIKCTRHIEFISFHKWHEQYDQNYINNVCGSVPAPFVGAPWGLKLHQIRCWSRRPYKKLPCELRGSAELEIAGAWSFWKFWRCLDCGWFPCLMWLLRLGLSGFVWLRGCQSDDTTWSSDRPANPNQTSFQRARIRKSKLWGWG